MKNHFILASGNITIGDHHGVVRVGGLTIYLDVVWTTLIAAAIVLGLGLLMRRKVTSGVPGKLQLFWEVVVEQVSDLAALGHRSRGPGLRGPRRDRRPLHPRL